MHWYRVFSLEETVPEPAELVDLCRRDAPDARGDFRGDDHGWFAATLHLHESAQIQIDRYLTSEDELRGELNSWAAWLEQTEHADSARLMQHLISCRQLFTLQASAEPTPIRALALLLTEKTDGILQLDGTGFLNASGQVLVPDA